MYFNLIAVIADGDGGTGESSKSSSDLNLVGLSRNFDSIPSVFTHDSLSSAGNVKISDTTRHVRVRGAMGLGFWI